MRPPAQLLWLKYWLAMVWLVPMLSASAAQDPAQLFDAANKLYEQGKFAEAATAYEGLVKSGKGSAAVYFNLGNAWFKSGQIGRAIYAYCTAEQVAPRDPDIRANLQFARNQVQGPTLRASFFERLLGKLTVDEWTVLATGCVWLLLLILALRQWRPNLKRALRTYLVVLVVIALGLCSFAAAAVERRVKGRTAVIVTRDAPLRQGPLDESQSVITLHDGAELVVLDQKGDWLQVSPDERRSGWIKRENVFLLGGK